MSGLFWIPSQWRVAALLRYNVRRMAWSDRQTLLIQRLIVWGALLATLAFAFVRLSPPTRDRMGFDTSRALQHLQFIASETHPVGSSHHEAVRGYIADELRKLGFEVQFQSGFLRVPLTNILARKAGTDPNHKAIALAAHYDSVPTGPGAADDGAAVAGLIEAARVLMQSPRKNDLILLITDGEERGMLGAQLFVNEPHPWLRDIEILLNFDARGTSGPSIMFETSAGNGWLIDLYAKNVSHPVCSSLSYDIYKRMRNNTDFTIFRDDGGLKGLNFAFIGTPQNYHHPTDDLNHLDPASLRHHGLQALELSDAMLNMDLTSPPSTRDAVYFDFASLMVIHYPANLAKLFNAIAVIVAMMTIEFLTRKRRAEIGKLFLAFAGLIGSLILSAGLAWIIRMMLPGLQSAGQLDITAVIYLIPTTVLAVGCISLMRWCNAYELAGAGLLFWIIPTLITAFTFRGGSYLAAWPLLFASLGVFAFANCGSNGLRPIIGIVFSMPAILLLGPMLYLALLGLGPGMAHLLVIPVAAAVWLLALPIRYPAVRSN